LKRKLFLSLLFNFCMSLYKTPETESYLLDFPSGKTKVFKVDRVARDRESFAQYWLKKQGFDAYQCNRTNREKIKDHMIVKNRLDILAQVDKVDSLYELFCEGCPDILAFNDAGYMFVEVKSMEDGLRKSQLEWMINFQDTFPIKIMYLE